MGKKRLAINITANLFSFGVSLGVTFFLTRYIIGNIGVEAYGFIPLINDMSNYVIIFTAALNTVAGRFISIEINSGNTDRAGEYFNSVMVANTAMAVALSLPAALLILNLNHIFDVPAGILGEVQLAFAFAVINIIISLSGNVFSVATFCRNRLDLGSIRAIQSNILKLVLTVVLFSAFSPKIYYITLTGIAATIFNVVANFFFTKRLLPEIRLAPSKFRLRTVMTMVSAGIWNSVSQLSTVLLSSLDMVIANILLGATIAGQYAVSKNVPVFAQALIVALSTVFTPQLVIHYAKKDYVSLIKNVNLGVKLLGLIVTLPISFLLVFGDRFFTLWVPGQDSAALHLLSNLSIIPMLITGSINVIFQIYTVTNKLKVPALVLLVSGVLNVLTVLLLLNTTELGIVAIPLTAMVTSILRNLLFTPLYASKCLGLKWTALYTAIIKAAVCSGVMMAICFGYRQLFPVDSWFGLILSAGVCASLALAANVFVLFDGSERRSALDALKKRLPGAGRRGGA